MLDIIDESGLVLKYVPTGREEFDADEVVQATLTRWLQNIGEAASRLSLELRSQYHEVPWQNITGWYRRWRPSSGSCRSPLPSVSATRANDPAPEYG